MDHISAAGASLSLSLYLLAVFLLERSGNETGVKSFREKLLIGTLKPRLQHDFSEGPSPQAGEQTVVKDAHEMHSEIETHFFLVCFSSSKPQSFLKGS